MIASRNRKSPQLLAHFQFILAIRKYKKIRSSNLSLVAVGVFWRSIAKEYSMGGLRYNSVAMSQCTST